MPANDRTAVLFPGQGSQTDDMRDSAAGCARTCSSLATEIVGEDPFAARRGGHPLRAARDLLRQPRRLTARSTMPSADALAGHSLGEFARAGRRGRARRARRARSSWPCAAADGRGGLRRPARGMLAVLERRARATPRPSPTRPRPDRRQRQRPRPGRALRRRADALDAATEAAEQRGPAGHAPAGQAAPSTRRRWSRRVPRLRAALDRDRASTRPRFPVFSSITAEPFDDVRAELALAPDPRRCAGARPLLALRDTGVRRFVETGPGKVADRARAPHARRRRGLRGRAGGRPCLTPLSATPPCRSVAARTLPDAGRPQRAHRRARRRRPRTGSSPAPASASAAPSTPTSA